MRYVGGYVVQQLMQKSKDSVVKQLLNELIDESDSTAEGPAQEWIDAIDGEG